MNLHADNKTFLFLLTIFVPTQPIYAFSTLSQCQTTATKYFNRLPHFPAITAMAEL